MTNTDQQRIAELPKPYKYLFSGALGAPQIPVFTAEQVIAAQAPLIERIKELEKNAARYSWLRSPERGMSNLVTVISDDFQPPFFELKCGEELDAAIDAALASSQQQKGEQHV